MKKSDWLKPVAEKILNQIKSGELTNIYASIATIQEIVFWFFNRDMLEELITVTNALTHLRNVRWIDVTPDICLTAVMLINEYHINPFDAYHAATAISQDKTILSTEHLYDRIKGITRVEPETLTKPG
ncbi:MAG: PIN domain-containing protein [Thermoproteota archaeon]|nr:PIN domain-containing protein [Thermoproteota archaeon]